MNHAGTLPRHMLAVRELTAEAFAPYGQIVAPLRTGGQGAETKYDPETSPSEAKLVLHNGEPRLFRVSRVVSAEADGAAVRRRDGVELADLWQALRRQVEERPATLAVLARVRRDWLGLFRRICAARYPTMRVISSVEILRLSEVEAALGATRFKKAVFDALRLARANPSRRTRDRPS